MNIDSQLDALIEREGGYSDNPADRGGPTRWGVTEHEARAYGYTGDMRDFPVASAKEIFRSRYWRVPQFDLVALRIPALGDELFDTGVLMGPQAATKFLQRALNVLNRGGETYPDIAVDGMIGRMTLYALDRYLQKRGKDGINVLINMVNALESTRMIEIAETNPSQEEFEFGWQLNRVTMSGGTSNG